MKNARHTNLFLRLLSGLVILCIGFAFVPMEVLHDHADEDNCHEAHVAEAISACHLSLYHPHELENEHCKHSTHLVEKEADCSLCAFLLTKRDSDGMALQGTPSWKADAPTTHTPLPELPSFSVIQTIPGRGPPAC